MFGTVITCYPVARKRKAWVGKAGRQLCLKPGLFWAVCALSSAKPVLKKQPQKHLLKNMTFYSTASGRHKKSKQVPAERLLFCICLSSRCLQNKFRDNKIHGACRSYCCHTHPYSSTFPCHQHGAPQGPRGSYRGNTLHMKRMCTSNLK